VREVLDESSYRFLIIRRTQKEGVELGMKEGSVD
jgi:hypothetical protein